MFHMCHEFYTRVGTAPTLCGVTVNHTPVVKSELTFDTDNENFPILYVLLLYSNWDPCNNLKGLRLSNRRKKKIKQTIF